MSPLFWIFVLIVGLPVVLSLVRRAIDRHATRETLWRGATPHRVPVVFLNGGMAVRPSVLGHPVPDGYRHACAFFGVGLIDRTQTLDQGYPVEVLDPIPTVRADVPTMAEICAARAAEIVAEARERDMPIRLLWSGGIDSTCAAVCLLEALEDENNRLEVAFSRKSVAENRRFHRLLKKRGVPRRRIAAVGEALDDDALIVTGEHGDQIFGSMLAAHLDFADLSRPWTSVMPGHIEKRIGEAGARSMLAYLEPQIAACPIPLRSTYDFLWWTNFSMKWQTVSLRVLATVDRERRQRAQPMLRHFFRSDDFQRWSLANPEGKIRDTWTSYKYPLKDIIFAVDGNARYRDRKLKERSLRGLTGGIARRALAIDADGFLFTEPVDRSILPRANRWKSEFSFDWE